MSRCVVGGGTPGYLLMGDGVFRKKKKSSNGIFNDIRVSTFTYLMFCAISNYIYFSSKAKLEVIVAEVI